MVSTTSYVDKNTTMRAYVVYLLFPHHLVVLYISTATEFNTGVVWPILTDLQGVVFR